MWGERIMIEDLNILDEKNLKILKQKSEEVIFPLSEDDLTTINNMIMYLRISQDEEYAEEHNLRAGMGLAAIQLGIPKRYFVISYKNEGKITGSKRIFN